MKQTRYRFLLPVVALMVAGSLAGCTKDDPTPNNPDRTTIAPLASLGTSSVEAGSAHSSSTQTKTVVSDVDALGLFFARADQTSASTYEGYQAAAITATRAAGSGEKTLTFNSVQYYRADGLKTKLTGWYPEGTYNGTARTVSWTIDGQQDVMTAPMQQGSRNSLMPAMTFDHRLTQLQFYPYAETQAAVDTWGKITKIEVLNQQNTVLYDLTKDASGAVSFSDDASYKFSAGIADGGASLSLSATANKVANVERMGNPVMIVPLSADTHMLTLRITTSKNKYKEVTLTHALTAGASYRLYMKFEELYINIEPTVSPWASATTNDKVGEIRVGDYLGGGIVYAVDGPRAKVLSLDQASSLIWSVHNTYIIGAAGENMTDGKANVAAMKAYSSDNINNADVTKKTTGNFATDFPAAHFCDSKNTGGITCWYLPAKDELVALYTAYGTYKTAIDAGIANNSGTAITASGTFWSSTGSSDYVSNAWYVNFSDGNTGSISKSNKYYVRCVRDL